MSMNPVASMLLVHRSHVFGSEISDIIAVMQTLYLTTRINHKVSVQCPGCNCNMGRTVTNVGRTCGPTPLLEFIDAIKYVYTNCNFPDVLVGVFQGSLRNMTHFYNPERLICRPI